MALLGALWLAGVVDQVDAGVALVEWGGVTFGTIPVDVLPPGIAEGDRVEVRIRRRDLAVVNAEHGAIALSLVVRPGLVRRARHPRSAGVGPGTTQGPRAPQTRRDRWTSSSPRPSSATRPSGAP